MLGLPDDYTGVMLTDQKQFVARENGNNKYMAFLR
jgi:hypothetical protein